MGSDWEACNSSSRPPGGAALREPRELPPGPVAAPAPRTSGPGAPAAGWLNVIDLAVR